MVAWYPTSTTEQKLGYQVTKVHESGAGESNVVCCVRHVLEELFRVIFKLNF